MSSKLYDLRRKQKSLEDLTTKMKNSQIPKLKNTIEYQKELTDGISKIREDSAMLPDMFRQLVSDSKELETKMIDAVGARDKALKDDTRLRKQVADLSSELERKKRLALQAIAARSNIKSELDEAIGKVQGAQDEAASFKAMIEEAKHERDRYATKHDEMFSSVSNLNARIEELE